MAKIHLTDELLMAFADGELDDAVSSAVEQAIAEDSGKRRQIAEFMRSRRLVRSALATTEALAVPAALAAAVARQVAASEGPSAKSSATSPPLKTSPALETSPALAVRRDTLRPGAPNRTSRPAPTWFLLAASLAALAIGAGGFVVGRQTSPGARGDADFLARLDAPEVDTVLASLPSGKEAAIALGLVRVVATYRTAGGSLCREFTVAGQAGDAKAVACRPNDGRPPNSWTLAFAQTDPTPQASAVKAPAEKAQPYAPADGESPVVTYLQGVGAGDPLDSNAELDALGR
jgi:anti-sigma factor RsiW